MSAETTQRDSCRKIRLALLFAALVGIFSPSCFAADVVSTWDGTTGLWTDAAKWDSVDFPDNGNGGFTYDAIVGAGTVSLTSQPITIEDLILSGGTIDGAEDLEVLGNLSWTAGGFAGTGATTVGGGTISGATAKDLKERTLQFAGDVSWTAGEILRPAGAADSFGTIEVQNGATFTSGGVTNRDLDANLTINSGGSFVNTGFRFTNLTGTLVNNGVVEVEQDGSLFLGGGSGSGNLIIGNNAGAIFELDDANDYQFTGNIILDGGTFDILLFGGGGIDFLLPSLLQGAGTFSGQTLINSAEVAPGDPLADDTSEIMIFGDYEQTSTGQLSVDVDGISTGDFDTLDISGDATLDGTVEVMIDDPADAPVGSVIEVVSANSVTGTFDRVITTGVDDIFLAPIYGAGSVSLQSMNIGDMNLSGGYDEADAVAFALALTDPESYFNTYAMEGNETGDTDFDADIDFDDIDDFVDLLNGNLVGGMTMQRMMEIVQTAQQQVPEPTGLVIVLSGCFLLFPSRRLHRCLT